MGSDHWRPSHLCHFYNYFSRFKEGTSCPLFKFYALKGATTETWSSILERITTQAQAHKSKGDYISWSEAYIPLPPQSRHWLWWWVIF